MLDDPRLLVVDDEAVICQACRRVFTRQGFQVEHSSDAAEGLRLATERDYAAILLDIKMPEMDGLEFLAELRKKKPHTPVILMTGYPSVPNAASAVRLGASDYVTKPFTPEEITQAVQRMLSPKEVLADAKPGADTWLPSGDEVRFVDEAWVRLGKDGTARVGAMLTLPREATVASIGLPRIGEVVFQGLPLAGLTLEGRPMRSIVAPLSGVIVAVNEMLKGAPTMLASDPCGDGWIAAIAPTRPDEELPACTRRTAILVNTDAGSAAEQVKRLAALGCVAQVAGAVGDVMGLLRNSDAPAVLLDDASLGAAGPELAGKLKVMAPSKKVVVVAGRQGENEAAYRTSGVFYYAIQPFVDGEIVQILDGLYCPAAPARPVAKPKGPSEPVNSISTISRNGKKTCLVTGGGLVRVDEGLGGCLRHKMLEQRLSLETILGNRAITPVRIADAAAKNDHVVVLLTKDVGRLPGSLVRDSKGEHVSLAHESVEKVTTLVIQPIGPDGGIDGLEPRTLAALAAHIANEMASC